MSKKIVEFAKEAVNEAKAIVDEGTKDLAVAKAVEEIVADVKVSALAPGDELLFQQLYNVYLRNVAKVEKLKNELHVLSLQVQADMNNATAKLQEILQKHPELMFNPETGQFLPKA